MLSEIDAHTVHLIKKCGSMEIKTSCLAMRKCGTKMDLRKAACGSGSVQSEVG